MKEDKQSKLRLQLAFDKLFKGGLRWILSGGQSFCQTLGLVLRLRVDFVLPLSQEQEEEEQEEEEQEEQEQEPPTKIYQMGVY